MYRRRRRFSAGGIGSAVINILPNDPLIEDSDFSADLTKNDDLVFGVRPVSFGAYQFANPGWRRRFNTEAPALILPIQNLNLQGNSYNGKGAVFVDGVLNQYFTSPQGAGTMNLRLDFEGEADREIELLMPSSAAIASRGVITYGYPITAPATRLNLPRAVFVGDSRAHGFAATSVDKHGFELLCQTKGWQNINLGYAGGVIQPAGIDWGTEVGNLSPDVVFMMFDKNNQAVQTALATFKADYITQIGNLRALEPTVNIYVISSNWINAANDNLPIKIAEYRQQEFDLVDELTLAGDTNLFYIDGLTMTTNSEASQDDGVHPNDAGWIEFNTNIAPLVSV